MRKSRECAKTSKQRVDEGRDYRSFGQHQQSAEKEHHNEHRHQPVFLSDAEESEEFAQKRHGQSRKWFLVEKLRTAGASIPIGADPPNAPANNSSCSGRV